MDTQDPIVVDITVRQADVFYAHQDGSDLLDTAMAAGVTWSRTRLTIPRTVEALDAIGQFIGMRAEIAHENLSDGDPMSASLRGEYRATLNLARKFTDARAALPAVPGEPVTVKPWVTAHVEELSIEDATVALFGAGFTIEYAHRDDSEDFGYLSPYRVHGKTYLAPDGAEPYVSFASIATSEHRAGQSTTWQRSNYRSLRRDYPNVFTDISYSDGDVLGAYVADVARVDGLVNILCGLSDQYPIYDESDVAELEADEISAAWRAYLASDTYRGLPEPLKLVWDGLTERDYEESLANQFYAAMANEGYCPEHDGRDIRWNEATVDRLVVRAIADTLRMFPRIAMDVARGIHRDFRTWHDYRSGDCAAAIRFVRESLSRVGA